MKFLIGSLIFVAVFSFAKSVASPSDLDNALSQTTVAQATAARNVAYATIVK